ncbi:MAG: hypothetical protein KH828_07675 [Clostridiales bacterium]|nr:hypothetical protein [Clostridiales bacterium]
MRGERFRRFYESAAAYVKERRDNGSSEHDLICGVIGKVTEIDQREFTGKQLRRIFGLVLEGGREK